MNYLPIVERELRMASRRGRTYYERAAVAAGFGVVVLLTTPMIPGRSGTLIFEMMAIGLAWFAVVSGWRSYDCISKEKREGTLGFLFLTDLKGSDIVLGKFAASAVPAIYAAMAVLPLLSMALLLGGVTVRQFCEVSLAVLNLFFLSHAAAVLGSAWFRDQKNAVGFPALIIVGYGIGLVLSAVAEEDYGWHATSLFLQSINPAYTLFIALAPGLPRALASYGISLAAVHFTGWLFLALASWVLPHRWQERPKRPNPLRTWYEQWRFGSIAKRAALRRQLIDTNAFFWLVSRRQLGPAAIWMALGASALSLVGIFAFAIKQNQDSWRDDYGFLFVIATVVFHLGLKLGIAGAASGSLQTQRDNGGLETVLCCTPLSTGDIIAGQWLALRRWLLRPALAILALGLVMIVLASVLPGQTFKELLWFLCTANLMLVPDMIALGWTAMWLTMSQPKARSNATVGTLNVCVAPWLIIGTLYGAMGAWSFMRRAPPLWVAWVLIGLTIDIGHCRIARRKLQKNFRQWAVPSYDPPLTLWGRLGRFLGRMTRHPFFDFARHWAFNARR